MDSFARIARERLEIEVPGFVDAVERQKTGFIMTTLREYPKDPALLYMAIWYATEHGASITFSP